VVKLGRAQRLVRTGETEILRADKNIPHPRPFPHCVEEGRKAIPPLQIFGEGLGGGDKKGRAEARPYRFLGRICAGRGNASPIQLIG
jgi:hypothetical protein